MHGDPHRGHRAAIFRPVGSALCLRRNLFPGPRRACLPGGRSLRLAADSSPAQLGKVRDKKHEWRATAIFAREELEILISDPRIPWDRRVLYALAGLAALRHGQSAAFRWRHVVSGLEPLGRIIIANSNAAETTKTGGERWMPMLPSGAASSRRRMKRLRAPEVARARTTAS